MALATKSVIGDMLLAAREKKKHTRLAAAETIGVTSTCIANWEHYGFTPQPAYVRALAKYLRVSAAVMGEIRAKQRRGR